MISNNYMLKYILIFSSYKVSLLHCCIFNHHFSDSPVHETNADQHFKSVDIGSIVGELLKHLQGDSEHSKFNALRWLLYLLKNFPKKVS